MLVTSVFLLGGALVGGGALVWAPWDDDGTEPGPETGTSPGEASETEPLGEQAVGGEGPQLQPPLDVVWRSSEGCAGRQHAITQDRVFILTGEACQDVSALDTHDGSLRWSSPTQAHEHDDDRSASRVELIDDIVLVSRDDPTFLSVDGGSRHVVTAFDAETGEVLWADGYLGWATDGDHLYASAPGRIEAIDPGTGAVRWSVEGNDEERIRSGAVVTDEQVAVVMAPAQQDMSGDLQFGELVALDADDGSELWRSSVALSSRSPLGIAELIVAAGSDGTAGVAGIDASSGELLWERSDLDLGQIDAVGDRIVAREDGDRTVLDPETGEVDWSVAGAASGPVTAQEGLLLVVDMEVGADLQRAAPSPELVAPGEDDESLRGTLRVGGEPVPGVEIDVRRDGQSVGASVSNADGEWMLAVPSAGTYEVHLQVETLPPGVGLRVPDRNPLELRVGEGQQSTALFVLQATVVERNLRAFQLDSGDEVWSIDLGEGSGVSDLAVQHDRLFVFGVDGSLSAWESAS